jgi:hypothetical protein
MGHTKHNKKNKTSFEVKTKENGEINPKYVDLLYEDKPIASQKFVCLSFVSPEKILKQKEIFYFSQFLKKWDFNKTMEVFISFLNFIAFKFKLSFDELYENFKDFIDDDEVKNSFKMDKLKEAYETFIEKNEETLEKEFSKINNFKTTMRGIKIRGSYPSIEEAELRAKLLREIDADHDIFVGQVGLWLPWDPDSNKTDRVEYSEELLNQLMHEKKKNEDNAKLAFEKRTKESKEQAMEDNIKNAKKTGNLLTQTIDSDGNLIGINNTQQSKLLKENEEVTIADIQTELFEGNNIITGKSDNGKSHLLSGPFANK